MDDGADDADAKIVLNNKQQKYVKQLFHWPIFDVISIYVPEAGQRHQTQIELSKRFHIFKD